MQAWLIRVRDIFLTENVITTILLLVIVITIQVIAVAALRRNKEVLSDTIRRWISIVRNISLIIILLGLLIIWTPELSALALSMAAFAVAIVIALKEFILSLVGAIYRASAQPFEIGDWIEIAGHRGEVTQEGVLSFHLLELGDGNRAHLYTGRTLVLPNSRLLTELVINESFRKKYLHHTFSIYLPEHTRPAAIARYVRARADHHQSDDIELAARYHAMVRRKIQADLPPITPTVRVSTTDLSRVVITVTLFCPAEKAARLESALTLDTLEYAVQVAASAAHPTRPVEDEAEDQKG